MNTATTVKRMTKSIKAEAVTAVNNLIIVLDSYKVSSDLTRIYDEDGGFYPMMYFRSGSEVIAVPEFYIGEDSIGFTGSQGNDYTLFGETLYEGFFVVEP